MQEFFDFCVWFVQEFTGMLLDLPFIPNSSYGEITFGSVLIGLTLICLLTVALIGSVKNWSLSGEARSMNRSGRFSQRGNP